MKRGRKRPNKNKNMTIYNNEVVVLLSSHQNFLYRGCPSLLNPLSIYGIEFIDKNLIVFSLFIIVNIVILICQQTDLLYTMNP